MDEKQILELRKFVNSITDAKIKAFIDLNKLCNSGLYNLSVKMAAEHAIAHGDFGYLNNIYSLLDGSPHASGFISSLSSKLSFVLTDTKPRKLKKATPEQAASAAKQVAIKPPAKKIATQKSVKKKPASKKSSNDLMDSRLMLPGCYGSSKRR